MQPRKGHEGPEGEQRYSSTLSLNSAPDGVVNATTQPLYLRVRDSVPIIHATWWAPGPVQTGAKNLAPTGIRSPDRPDRSKSLCRLGYSGPTQPLTEMSTRSISLGLKNGRCVRLTTLPPFCAVVMKSGNLNFLEPSRHLVPVMGLIYLYHGRCVRLTTLPPSCAAVTKSGNLNFLEPSGHLVPVMGLFLLPFFQFAANESQIPSYYKVSCKYIRWCAGLLRASNNNNSLFCLLRL